jgi:4-hydroxybenzoate polyprenyltransferase
MKRMAHKRAGGRAKDRAQRGVPPVMVTQLPVPAIQQRPGWRQRLRNYALLMRLDRPVGILLLLWPTLWALWMAAEGRPDPGLLTVFVLGTILMRSAGCVINDVLDRRYDGHVRRTRNRPLVRGSVSAREALMLFAMLVLAAAVLVLYTNPLTALLAFIALPLAATYPLAKRYTYLPQFHLGLAFGWGIPMAYAAQLGMLPPTAWLLLIANVLWSVAYDTMYAMVDREDDIRIGVKSTAILFDDADRVIIGAIQAMLLLVLAIVGARNDLGGWYYSGLLAAAGFSIFQQWLIRDRRPEGCFRAFRNNNWLGMVVFAGIVLDYWPGS